MASRCLKNHISHITTNMECPCFQNLIIHKKATKIFFSYKFKQMENLSPFAKPSSTLPFPSNKNSYYRDKFQQKDDCSKEEESYAEEREC